MRHRAISPLAIALLLSTALAGQKRQGSAAPKTAPEPRAAGPGAPAGKAAPRGGENARKTSGQNAPKADPHPGERAFDRLQEMTPEQRKKWLQSLPPERRQRIEKALQTVAKMPPAALNRMRSRLERLDELPPQKQGQVRRSLQQFNNLAPERKAQISEELQRMSAMPDDDRRAHMNSEEFRNRYSPMEQQMMSNLNEIAPE